jgi:hypothetical protein
VLDHLKHKGIIITNDELTAKAAEIAEDAMKQLNAPLS